MASWTPIDVESYNINTYSRKMETMKWKLRDMFQKTTNFVKWCLVDDKEPSPDSIPTEQPFRPSSTAYLTGLRGVAAVFVYHFHLISDSFPDGIDPFVSWRVSSFFQLPVVRIIYAGGPMVALFFIISGFVLSIKPLRLAQQGRWIEFLRSLASSVFRRGPRLFLPCIPSTFVVMLAAHFGLFPEKARMAPVIQENLWAQLVDWISFFFFTVLNFWSWEEQNPKSNYGGHLWTIPFEFRDSMILYITVLGTAALHENLFPIINLAPLLYYLVYGKWDVSLFILGMLLAYSSDRPRLAFLRGGIKSAFAIGAFFIGIYLVSLPPGDGSVWFTSPGVLGTGVGLLLIMDSLTHNSWLQRIFSSKPIQYLGDISFALYIIHEPTLQLIGWRMVRWLTNILGGSWALGLVGTWILLTPPLFFLASLYSRYVEKPSLALARWLESQCLVNITAVQDVDPELMDLISG